MRWQILSIKVKIANIFGFAVYVIGVATMQLSLLQKSHHALSKWLGIAVFRENSCVDNIHLELPRRRVWGGFK